MDIPGPSTVRIDVIEISKIFGLETDKILGYTELDI
jgi:hypothetical protein